MHEPIISIGILNVPRGFLGPLGVYQYYGFSAADQFGGPAVDPRAGEVHSALELSLQKMAVLSFRFCPTCPWSTALRPEVNPLRL